MPSLNNPSTRHVRQNNVLVELGTAVFTPPGGGGGTPIDGSYVSDPAYDILRWSEPLRSYISEALANLDRIHDSEAMPSVERNITLQQILLEEQMYHVGRPLIRSLYPAAHLLFLTGAPAIVTVFNDLLGRYITHCKETDAYGTKMLDWSNASGDPSTYDSNVVRLEDSMCCGGLAIMVRVCHENSTSNAAEGLDILKGAWRRWAAGGWNGGASLDHADPSLDRPFAHAIAARANMAWHLWKITGDQNYKDGFDILLDWEFNGIGKEVGANRMCAAFGNSPSGNSYPDALPRTYSRYAFALLKVLHSEGAFDSYASFNLSHFEAGIHHYLLRDADVDYSPDPSGVRDDMTGSCANNCGASSVTFERYDGGGQHTVNPSRFGNRRDLNTWGQYFWMAAPSSSVLTDNALSVRTANHETYTHLMGWPMSLIVANWEEPS